MITIIYYLDNLHFLFGVFFFLCAFSKNVLSFKQGIVTKKGWRRTYIPSLNFLSTIKEKEIFYFIAYFPLLERKVQKKKNKKHRWSLQFTIWWCHYFHHFFIIYNFKLKHPTFHMEFWTKHMFHDIYKVTYQYIW